jgi:hypothetical protein
MNNTEKEDIRHHAKELHHKYMGLSDIWGYEWESDRLAALHDVLDLCDDVIALTDDIGD